MTVNTESPLSGKAGRVFFGGQAWPRLSQKPRARNVRTVMMTNPTLPA